nr:MAG: hypothetical protein A2V48_03130 [Candidatus Amesbacteria bacterium RBG_19FT_COMBO_48_16]
MAFDLITRPFWRWPAVFEDDEDWLVPATGTPGGITISEDDKNVFVSASLPGVAENDIDVTFDKGSLWIKGESRQEEENKKLKYYRKATSSFSYRVAVPGELDPNVEPESAYKNGVITVKFTKTPASQPKKIAVRSKK